VPVPAGTVSRRSWLHGAADAHRMQLPGQRHLAGFPAGDGQLPGNALKVDDADAAGGDPDGPRHGPLAGASPGGHARGIGTSRCQQDGSGGGAGHDRARRQRDAPHAMPA